MQSFIVLASLVFELAGGGGVKMTLLSGPLRYKKHLPLFWPSTEKFLITSNSNLSRITQERLKFFQQDFEHS